MARKAKAVTTGVNKGHRQTITFEDLVWKNMQPNMGQSELFKDPNHASNLAIKEYLISKGLWREDE